MKETYENISIKLKGLRAEKGYSHEEMAEKLGETPEKIKEYMSKITLEDIHEAFQDFRDAMVATKENN